MYCPRGTIVCPSRPVDLGGGLIAAGRKPGIIVYIKAGSGRLTREFHRFCDRHGVDALPVQERVEDERAEAFECVGAVESLERLIAHPAVARWHYILSVRPPLSAMGVGETKPRPTGGTAFGRPATVRATTAKLNDDRQRRHAAAVSAGEL